MFPQLTGFQIILAYTAYFSQCTPNLSENTSTGLLRFQIILAYTIARHRETPSTLPPPTSRHRASNHLRTDTRRQGEQARRIGGMSSKPAARIWRLSRQPRKVGYPLFPRSTHPALSKSTTGNPSTSANTRTPAKWGTHFSREVPTPLCMGWVPRGG